MKTKTTKKPQSSPQMQAALRFFGNIAVDVNTNDTNDTYTARLHGSSDSGGIRPMTAAEAWIDNVMNPTEPNSQERFDTVNRRARGVREAIAAMTPEEYSEWASAYYLGMMVPPFGLDNDDGKGHDGLHLVPHGMSSVIDLPKLHPDDL